MSAPARLPTAIAAIVSLAFLVLPFQTLWVVALTPLEALASVSYAWSVWLLAKNKPAGWVVGLIGVSAYAVVFYRVGLYAEVGLQAVYFLTSLQAIYVWRQGNTERAERPVGRVPWPWLVATGVLVAVATVGLRELLIAWRGAAPFWDALTTVVSLVAHFYLIARLRESWYLWIVVDTIYVPLYASRSLYLTSALYGVFWVMAIYGAIEFHRLHREQQTKS